MCIKTLVTAGENANNYCGQDRKSVDIRIKNTVSTTRLRCHLFEVNNEKLCSGRNRPPVGCGDPALDQVCKDHHCCWFYIRRRSTNWLSVRRRPRSRDGYVFQRVAGRPSHRRVLTKPLVQMVQCSNCTSDMFRFQSCSQAVLHRVALYPTWFTVHVMAHKNRYNAVGIAAT